MLVAAAAAVLWLWPRSSAGTETALGRSETYAVELTTSPRKGEIAASVRITRHDRAPVSLDEVMIDSVMPAMGHAMSQVVARKQEDRFEARGELFTMSGVWDVSLRVGNETVTVQMTVTG